MTLPAINDILDTTYIRIASDIAANINDIETILNRHSITPERWRTIQKDPKFQELLKDQILAWNSTTNADERVKLKASILVEQWLPELNTRMHDANENLRDKIEAGKLATRLAGMGIEKADVAGGGERFQVTINLGADQKLTFAKDVTPRVIDHNPMEQQ